ncbi:MAG TPA: SRPBCC domain-containing protein [Gaiellaceae bacterium]|nr:SRPBCC domain-containing protein [Gaiellaceae bacterium]
MKLQGERRFDAPRGTVWGVLQDPAQMAKLMPHVESFEVEDDRRWKANVKIPLGLGSLKMSIKFEKLEERPPEYSRLQAKGTGVGALMNLVTQFNLADQNSGTAMAWEADVRIAGPVGSMGQRVLQPIVNQQVQLVLTALDKQVATVGGASTKGAEEGLSPLEEESYKAEQ